MVIVIGFIVFFTTAISLAILKLAKVSDKESLMLALVPHLVLLGAAALLFAINWIFPGMNHGWTNLGLVIFAVTFLVSFGVGTALTIILYLFIKR